MRIWHIPPEYLDSKRLFAAHHEIHGLRTSVLKGTSWHHFRQFYYGKCDYFHYIHDSLVIEMRIRTNSAEEHKTPYERLPDEFYGEFYRPTNDDRLKDVTQLRQKWDREGYYFGTGRSDLRVMERMLGLVEGISPEVALEVKAQTREFVKEHREEINALGRMTLGEKLEILRSGAKIVPTSTDIPKLVL